MKILIENFKSIKHLELNLAKVNVLIGPPASGKSNILEALAFSNLIRKVAEYSVGEIKSEGYADRKYLLKDYFIYLRAAEDLKSLFFGKKWNEEIKIKINETEIRFKYDQINDRLLFYHNLLGEFSLDEYYPDRNEAESFLEKETPIRLYKTFYKSDFYSDKYLIEFGTGIHKFIHLYEEEINSILEELRLFIISVGKNVEIIDIQNKKHYPFEKLSDGLKRIIYLLCAIKSNDTYYKPSLVLLEEPEIHVFPYYLDIISDLILDVKNVTILFSTHNEEFLFRLLNKADNRKILENIKVFYISRDTERGTYVKEEKSGKEVFNKIIGGEIAIKYEI